MVATSLLKVAQIGRLGPKWSELGQNRPQITKNAAKQMANKLRTEQLGSWVPIGTFGGPCVFGRLLAPNLIQGSLGPETRMLPHLVLCGPICNPVSTLRCNTPVLVDSIPLRMAKTHPYTIVSALDGSRPGLGLSWVWAGSQGAWLGDGVKKDSKNIVA